MIAQIKPALLIGVIVGVVCGFLQCLCATPRIKAEVSSLAPWPSWRGGHANTACATANCARARLLWQRSIGLGQLSSPVLGSDGSIYVNFRGSTDERLYALDAGTGEVRWSVKVWRSEGHPPIVPLLGAPVVGAGFIYVGSLDGSLYAVSTTNHQVKWSVPLGSELLSSPNVGPNGDLYVGSQDGDLFAMDAESGAVRWKKHLGPALPASCAISRNGLLFVGSPGGIKALKTADGSVVWTIPGTTAWSTPTIARDGTVYASTQDGDQNLISADSVTGRTKWRSSVGLDPSQVALGPGNRVYVQSAAGTKGTLYALDGSTGRALWRFRGVSGDASPVVTADGCVYAFAHPKLLALDDRSGHVKWHLNVGVPRSVLSPAIGKNGTLYFTSGTGFQDAAVFAVH